MDFSSMEVPCDAVNFPEFVDAATERLKKLGCRGFQRHETEGKDAVWWVSFTRAGCVYRLKYERRDTTLALERGQGSFVVQSPMTWRLLETRQHEDQNFETALAAADVLLQRFEPAKR